MTINENGRKLTVTLEGRLDTNNAAQTESEVFEAAEGANNSGSDST